MRQTLKAASMVVYSKTSYETQRDLRVMLFRKVMCAEMRFFDELHSGSMVNDIIKESERANGVIFGFLHIVAAVFLLTVYVSVMVYASSWVVLMVIGLAALFAFLLKGILRRALSHSHDVARYNQALSTFVVERLRSIRHIRLSNSASVEQDRIYSAATNLSNTMTALVKLRARIPFLIEPPVLILALGFLSISTTVFDLQFEVVLALMGALVRLLPVSQEIANNTQGILESYGSLKVVLARLTEVDAAAETKGGTSELPETLSNGIRFCDVSFTYLQSKEAALHCIDLKFAAGQVNAVVGPSGAGKSTVVDLLLRLRDPNQGTIYVDDVPIENYSMSNLRDSVSFVSQAPRLFDGTIAEHIRYGNPDADDEQIRLATDLAGAADFISSLPATFDTRIGEDGSLLSGGQRQRLELARALAKRSPIMVLDEPASGLDADATDHLRQTLNRIRDETGITIILIAHGFSCVVGADHIIVLESGQITDAGTHNDLMRREGWYAQAFAKQTRTVPIKELVSNLREGSGVRV